MEETHAKTEIIIGNWMKARNNRDKVREAKGNMLGFRHTSTAPAAKETCLIIGSRQLLCVVQLQTQQQRFATLASDQPFSSRDPVEVVQSYNQQEAFSCHVTVGADCYQGGVLHAGL